jgi:hypothetical protein
MRYLSATSFLLLCATESRNPNRVHPSLILSIRGYKVSNPLLGRQLFSAPPARFSTDRAGRKSVEKKRKTVEVRLISAEVC